MEQTTSFKSTLLTCFLFLFIFQLEAMVIRHDTKQSSYIVKESDYPAIFPLLEQNGNKECVATLIDKNWAITAAHCAVLLITPEKVISHKVRINGKSNEVIAVEIPKQYGTIKPVVDSDGNLIDFQGVEDESYDIALLKLKTPVSDIKPYELYREKNETGKEMQLLGWGDFATGDKGYSPNNPFNDGKFRQAWNTITATSGNYLVFAFDHPDESNSLPLEGVAGPGDSGGPALVKTDKGMQIIGISSGGAYPDELAKKYNKLGKYGWQEYYIRTSMLYDWITTTVAKK